MTLGGGAARRPGGQRRYFGRGDVLRDATLELSDGVRVEIDSLFQNCEVRLRPGTELVVGPSGVLADCRIVGAGDITIQGQFFERNSPGILGPRRLAVAGRGAIVATIEQAPELTQFAFERGSRLRLRIVKATGQSSSAPKGG